MPFWFLQYVPEIECSKIVFADPFESLVNAALLMRYNLESTLGQEQTNFRERMINLEFRKASKKRHFLLLKCNSKKDLNEKNDSIKKSDHKNSTEECKNSWLKFWDRLKRQIDGADIMSENFKLITHFIPNFKWEMIKKYILMHDIYNLFKYAIH